MAGSSRRSGPAATDTEALNAEILKLREELASARAEAEQLRETETMYRAAAELAGRMVWSMDADGYVTRMSRVYRLMTGLTEIQATGEGWLEQVHPDDREHILCRGAEAREAGEPFEIQFRAMLPDGSTRLLLSRAVPVRAADGQIVQWYGTTCDIEEESQAERARLDAEERLRESEELYRYAVELSGFIVWTADPEGKLLTISQRYWDLTGAEPTLSPAAAIHPDDRGMVMTSWRNSIETGAPHAVEYRLQCADGGYRYFRARAAPRRDETGGIVRWYGTTEDIDDRKQANLALHEAEERYRLALQATRDVIWDYDLSAGTIEWSDTAAEMFGRTAPLGTTQDSFWVEHIHPEDRARVVAKLNRAVQGRQTRWADEYRLNRENGQVADVLDRCSIIRDEDGNGIRAIGAMVDLTELRRAEDEIRRMQSELIHVSRVSAMGAMASTLAHELNQPLSAVANYVRGARRLVVRRSEAAGAALDEALKAAEAGALRAGEIVRRMRELVAHGKVTVAVEDLHRLVEEACVLAFVDAESLGIRRRVELDPAARWVRADRIQVQQVLINLVRNAVQALGDSQVREVVISTHASSSDMVEVRVADTGPGIAPELLESLFSQFMTTKTEGMGLGLPISRTIVEAHGGWIMAENGRNGGAVFRFALPRAPAR